ncbi:MAG: hypothetical protein M1839_007730 [Geoglossum umbratile]|nr:MAG: hypothetical protein M1839_007730 [Geoglossum umbratile]
MADDSSSADETPITFNVKSSSDAKFALTLPLNTTVLDLKNKLAEPEFADIPAERQRLIYSGSILKDGETLSHYKIKDGHTVHLVKSAASNQRQNPASSTTGGQAAGVPTNFATGTATGDPLAGLTGARYAGLAPLPGAGMFGPDGGMGAPPDPEQVIQMLQNPEFVQTMNAALQNPQFLDMILRSNPVLENMGPGVRQMMLSDEFRRMLTDPDTIRHVTQVGRQLGVGPWAGGGGAEAFPAPGVTAQTPASDTPSTESRGTPGQQQQQQPNPLGPNPFASLFGIPPPGTTGNQAGTTPQPNPFAVPFPPPATTTAATPSTNATGVQPNQPPNPFASLFLPPNAQDPQALQQLLAAMGGAGSPPPGAGFNPFLGLGGAPPPPADTRAPEDRYADQLRQLNDMGFYDFDRNVEALRRTGGSVQGAVDYLLSH